MLDLAVFVSSSFRGIQRQDILFTPIAKYPAILILYQVLITIYRVWRACRGCARQTRMTLAKSNQSIRASS